MTRSPYNSFSHIRFCIRIRIRFRFHFGIHDDKRVICRPICRGTSFVSPSPSAGEDVQKGKVPKKVGGERGQVWSGCGFPVPPSVCGNVLKGHPSCRATMRTASTGFGVATSVLACCLLPLVACTRVLCVCFICRPSRRWRSVGQPDKQVAGSRQRSRATCSPRCCRPAFFNGILRLTSTVSVSDSVSVSVSIAEQVLLPLPFALTVLSPLWPAGIEIVIVTVSSSSSTFCQTIFYSMGEQTDVVSLTIVSLFKWQT